MDEILGVSPEAFDLILALLVIGLLIVAAIFVNGYLTRKAIRAASDAQIHQSNAVERLRRQEEEKRFRPETLARQARELAVFAEQFVNNPRLAVNARLAGALKLVESYDDLIERTRKSLSVAADELRRIEGRQAKASAVEVPQLQARTTEGRRLVAEITDQLSRLSDKYGEALDMFDELSLKVSQAARPE